MAHTLTQWHNSRGGAAPSATNSGLVNKCSDGVVSQPGDSLKGSESEGVDELSSALQATIGAMISDQVSVAGKQIASNLADTLRNELAQLFPKQDDDSGSESEGDTPARGRWPPLAGPGQALSYPLAQRASQGLSAEAPLLFPTSAGCAERHILPQLSGAQVE